MPAPTYQAYSVRNFRQIPQIQSWPEHAVKEIETVARVLPFKTNNYVVDELIDWNNIPADPMYTLNFPRHELLKTAHWQKMARAAEKALPESELKALARSVQMELNPDPSNQSANVPLLHGHRVSGAQHKYRETVLFFPQAGQTCHAYCTFCFRWPQFSGLSHSRFSGHDSRVLADYLKIHPKVTDLLITGGDPMVMKAQTLAGYLEPFLSAELPHLKTIRIGTKSLSYWPYRYLSDADSDEVLRVFEKVVQSGRTLSVMAHFNHPVELGTEAVRKAIKRIQGTGAQIRTQSPLLRHINDKPEFWSEMWRKQVDLNCIPYYMFVERDTGAKHFFAVPLERCWNIFRRAYRQVSGVCRTVRGPVMSASPGKVQILGLTEIYGEKVFVLRFLQGRNAAWVDKPFFAAYDPNASWLSGLKPAFGEPSFFFESEMKGLLSSHMQPMG